MISVIICTHNPREDFLRRTLAALRAQTLPTTRWELLLIDNASEKSLSALWDLSWQPNARHLRENELGLTPARLCGIREAKGELLVFVDDDNILASDYLAATAELFSKRADLGVASGRSWGALALAALGFLGVGLGAGAAGTSVLATLASGVAPERRAGAATLVWVMMIFGFALTAPLAEKKHKRTHAPDAAASAPSKPSASPSQANPCQRQPE